MSGVHLLLRVSNCVLIASSRSYTSLQFDLFIFEFCCLLCFAAWFSVSEGDWILDQHVELCFPTSIFMYLFRACRNPAWPCFSVFEESPSSPPELLRCCVSYPWTFEPATASVCSGVSGPYEGFDLTFLLFLVLKANVYTSLVFGP